MQELAGTGQWSKRAAPNAARVLKHAASSKEFDKNNDAKKDKASGKLKYLSDADTETQGSDNCNADKKLTKVGFRAKVVARDFEQRWGVAEERLSRHCFVIC